MTFPSSKSLLASYYGTEFDLATRTPDQRLTAALLKLSDAQADVIRELTAVVEEQRDENARHVKRQFGEALDKTATP